MKTIHLVVMVVVGSCILSCTGPPGHPYWVFHAKMPPEKSVGLIGEYEGLPFTVASAGDAHLGGPIRLNVKVANPSSLERDVCPFGIGDPFNSLAIWLLHNGHQVLLTEYGEDELARYWADRFQEGNCWPTIKPGAELVVKTDLAKVFQISEPGLYTVIVESGPVRDFDAFGKQLPTKTSFVILP